MAIDIVGLIPVVGAIKYADEVGTVIKNADEAGEIIEGAGRHVDDVVEDAGKGTNPKVEGRGQSKGGHQPGNIKE
jgi:hypothetical protein